MSEVAVMADGVTITAEAARRLTDQIKAAVEVTWQLIIDAYVSRAMEVVSMLAKQPWTDSPTCTNEVITRAAQTVNDRLNDTERQRLVTLIPRILRARRTPSDRRVNVRLAIWSARSVLHLVREQDRDVCEAAIAAAEAWIEGTGTATAAYAAAAAAADAYAAAADAYAAAAAAADADADPVAWLDQLLDVWEKAVNEEGEALWVPTEWEDEALAFLDELNAEAAS